MNINTSDATPQITVSLKYVVIASNIRGCLFFISILQVRLLFIPVMNANVYGTLLLVSFLLLILVQTGVIKGPSNYL